MRLSRHDLSWTLSLLALVTLAACTGEQTPCSAGEANCTCRSDGSCGAGLQCKADVCAPISADGCTEGDLACACAGGRCIALVVGEASVRSCDVLVGLGDRRLRSITYAAGARGQHLAKGDRLAVSFTSRVDAPFAGAPLGLVLEGASSLASAVKSSEVHCFDRAGQPVADPKVALR